MACLMNVSAGVGTRFWRRGRFALLAVIAMLCAATFGTITSATAAETWSSNLEPLTIVTGKGEFVFHVEVAQTDEQRMRGLMHRRHMPADRGMIFLYEQEEPVAMWMENTYISLDMLFVRADGTVANIVTHAEPLSRRLLPSAGPVATVIELNAGEAGRIGVKPGDRIIFRR